MIKVRLNGRSWDVRCRDMNQRRYPCLHRLAVRHNEVHMRVNVRRTRETQTPLQDFTLRPE